MGRIKRALSNGTGRKIFVGTVVALVAAGVPAAIALEARVGRAEEVNSRQDRTDDRHELEIRRLQEKGAAVPDAIDGAVRELKRDLDVRFDREATIQSQRHEEILDQIKELRNR